MPVLSRPPLLPLIDPSCKAILATLRTKSAGRPFSLVQHSQPECVKGLLADAVAHAEDHIDVACGKI